MALRKIALTALLAAAFVWPMSSSMAQEKYPARPIEFVVPWGPGGGADVMARKVGKLLEPIVKVSLPVINVPGATGQTGLNKMLKGEADGYTMEVMTGDTFGTLAAPSPKWSLKDIVPLAITIRTPSGFFVQEGGKFKTWADVEKAAKTTSLKVAITGFGSPDDYTVKYLNKKGMKFVSVPFAKPGERYTAILGGHADLLYEQAGDVKSYIKNKQMRPVIFFAEKRDPGFPDVPASAEFKHNIFLPQFRMIIMKAGTPADRIKVLSDALAQVAKSPDYATYLKEELGAPDSFMASATASKFLAEQLEDLKKFAK